VSKAVFSDWLLEQITKRDLTRKRLADLVGVSDETIRRWLNPDDSDLPAGRHIVPLAKALDVSPAAVVNRFPDAPPLDAMETFYANIPGDLTEEEQRGILAYIRGMRRSG
jgi:transcriptional regulator with XRE-family HTH domain